MKKGTLYGKGERGKLNNMSVSSLHGGGYSSVSWAASMHKVFAVIMNRNPSTYMVLFVTGKCEKKEDGRRSWRERWK